MNTLQRDRNGPSVELIPGRAETRTGIATAVREGLVRAIPGGGFEDVTTPDGAQRTLATAEGEREADAQEQAKAAERHATENAAFIDSEDEQLWQEDIESLPQHAYDGAVSSVVAVVAVGQGSLEDTAKSLSAATGMEPSLALEYVEQGIAKEERVVARVLAKAGISENQKEAAYQFFREQPQKLQNAIQMLTHQRDVSAFKELAVAYRVANPGDLSAFKAAGFETAVDRTDGTVMLKRGGGNWVRASELKRGAQHHEKAKHSPHLGPRCDLPRPSGSRTCESHSGLRVGLGALLCE
jgi:hypothetical protein